MDCIFNYFDDIIYTDPWLNDTTRAIRQHCRPAEHRLTKDKLHVSLEMLRDCLTDYQRAVREANSQYLSNIISSSSHCPKVLFDTINAVVNPCTSAVTDVSIATRENFLLYFVDKVDSVRTDINVILSTNKDLPVVPTHSAVFDQFELVSLSCLCDVVKSLKPTNCRLDIVPAKVLKMFFNTVGPSLLVPVDPEPSHASRVGWNYLHLYAGISNSYTMQLNRPTLKRNLKREPVFLM